jgi:hypothetical protein
LGAVNIAVGLLKGILAPTALHAATHAGPGTLTVIAAPTADTVTTPTAALHAGTITSVNTLSCLIEGVTNPALAVHAPACRPNVKPGVVAPTAVAQLGTVVNPTVGLLIIDAAIAPAAATHTGTVVNIADGFEISEGVTNP